MFWRYVFLAVETYVVSVVSLEAIGRQFFGTDYLLESEFCEFTFGVSFILAWLFLLIVSPLFLRSLRPIALVGWIIAFGALAIEILMPPL